MLLLDEPFGALDAKVRQELRRWLRRLHDDIGVTSVFVTHDQEEAFEVADQVVVMGAGKVEQVGTPQEVFEHPANAFVMDFLGNVNVFHGRVHRGRAVLGDWEVSCPEHAAAESSPAELYVRPHELELSPHANGSGGLRARVMHVNPAGPVTRVQLEALEQELVIQVDVSPERYAELGLRAGDSVTVSPRRARVFVPDYSI
jgi:sulfate transport system ATP-binding protein